MEEDCSIWPNFDPARTGLFCRADRAGNVCLGNAGGGAAHGGYATSICRSIRR